MSVREPRTIEGWYNNGDTEVVRKLCHQWKKEKMVNPITNKPLPAGTKSKVYQSYEKICCELGINSQSSSKAKISASETESSDLQLAKHMSKLDIDEHLDTVGRWAFKKCANDNPITLMPFDNDDADVVSIRVQRSDGKFVKKGMCVTKSSLFRFAYNDLDVDHVIYKLPQMFMSNWIPKGLNAIQENGMGGHAGKKIFVKLPPNNIFVSLTSFLRLMNSRDEKEWYAIPMFEGRKQRIGNMFSMLTVIGTTHGQAPGSIVYKLHTRKEVESQPHLLGIEDKKEYHVGKYKPTAFDLEHQSMNQQMVRILIKMIVQDGLLPYTIYAQR